MGLTPTPHCAWARAGVLTPKALEAPTALAPGTRCPSTTSLEPCFQNSPTLQGYCHGTYWGSCTHISTLQESLSPGPCSHMCPIVLGILLSQGFCSPEIPLPQCPVSPGSNSHRGPAPMGDPAHPCPCISAVLLYVHAVYPCALTLHICVHISLLSSCRSVHPCGTCPSACAASGCCVPGASLRDSTSPTPVMPETWVRSHLYSHLWPAATISITLPQ